MRTLRIKIMKHAILLKKKSPKTFVACDRRSHSSVPIYGTAKIHAVGPAAPGVGLRYTGASTAVAGRQ